MTLQRVPALCALALAGALAGCGLTGDLQRPDPIFGEPDGSEAATLPDRQVERGLPDRTTSQDGLDDGAPSSDLPDADDELLGGPGGA